MISLDSIFIAIRKLRNVFKKKHQKYFYPIENFKKVIKLNNKLIFNFENIFITSDSLVKNYLFKKNVKKCKKVILRISSQNKDIFTYFLDGKKFSRKIIQNNLNFLKIDVNNKNQISFKNTPEFKTFKPILINKKAQRKLVLILFIDGFGKNLVKYFPNTMKFFGKNNFFNNVWSNSNWTLPSYGNLITGKYVAGHGCFDSETFYNDQSQVKYNTKMNLYESFSKNNFVIC